MSALFNINFRREAYLKEIARTRQRVFALGGWVAYFGVLALILGLYGLNCVSLTRRIGRLERQTARFQGAQGTGMDWIVRSTELAQVERYVASPRDWHDLLVRLAAILPTNARLTSLAVDPQSSAGGAEQSKLVITGLVKGAAGQDRMQAVMKIVSTIHDDSVFVRSYRNVKLASTRVLEDAEGMAEFVIECR